VTRPIVAFWTIKASPSTGAAGGAVAVKVVIFATVFAAITAGFRTGGKAVSKLQQARATGIPQLTWVSINI
jgi:hypothetical protein